MPITTITDHLLTLTAEILFAIAKWTSSLAITTVVSIVAADNPSIAGDEVVE